MFAALMIGHHFSISALWNAASPSGVCCWREATSSPSSAKRARSVDQGLDIPPRDQQTPEALAAFQKAEIEKWWPIIKAAGIKGE